MVKSVPRPSLLRGALVLTAFSLGACDLSVLSPEGEDSSPLPIDGGDAGGTEADGGASGGGGSGGGGFSEVGGGGDPVEPAVLQYVAKSVADHGASFQLSLDIADSSFIEPRQTTFVRLSLSEAVDPASATDASVTVLSNGTVSTSSGSAVVSLSGDDLEVRHADFFSASNPNAKLCIVLDGLKRADGASYPREVIKFSRLVADNNGDGVVASGSGSPDFLAVQGNFFHELGDGSNETQIRADLNTDGVIEIFDYSVYVTYRNNTLPGSWPAGCD